MDADFWAARVHRNIPSGQSARLINSVMEDGGGDEVRAWFPCPFCYVEIEVPLLCIHLQEEHCFDLKNAVCPICAANLGRDPLSHFTVQHAHSIKRRRKSQKSGFWNNVPSNIVKDLRELTSFLGANSLTGTGGGNEPATDPLLSPFICNVPLTAPTEGQKDASSHAAATSDAERQVSPPSEAEEQDLEERKRRATFLQQLVLSTIFDNL